MDSSSITCSNVYLAWQQEGEDETSGGSEWEGKEGWELSDERVEKLKGRLANLERLKEERATEMVGLVVACQKRFVQLGLQCTNPLQTKVRVYTLGALLPSVIV